MPSQKVQKNVMTFYESINYGPPRHNSARKIWFAGGEPSSVLCSFMKRKISKKSNHFIKKAAPPFIKKSPAGLPYMRLFSPYRC